MHTLFLAAVIVVIGELLETSAYKIAQLTVGRVVLGIGVGQLSATVPVFQAECSSAKNRGQHVVVDGICMVLGFVLCNWIDFGLSKTSGQMQFRVPLALSFLFPLIILASVFFLPESPRWLVLVGRPGDAARSLAAYRGLPVEDEAIQAEIASIESALELTEQSGRITLREVFSRTNEDRLFYRFTLCMAIQFFQQMCGGNLISTYISTIFEQNLKLGSDLSRILASSALTWKFLCNFIPFFAIDRLGRRKVFIFSGTGMCICMTVLAVTTSFDTSNKTASVLSVAFIWLFNLFYPIGFSGANFLYCTEVAPIQLRVAMASISTANKWLWNFIVVMITPVALDTIGYQYYIVYAAISACIPVSVYLFYPETMGRNLEFLNQVFRDAPSVWHVVAMAKALPKGDVSTLDMERVEKKLDAEQREHPIYKCHVVIILKYRPDEGPKAKIEAKTLDFLAKSTTGTNIEIPAPRHIRDWVDRDGRYFALTERIQGQTLEQAWPTLSESQRISIADQVVQVRKQLRSNFTSTTMQSVDQGPCYPGLLFLDMEPYGPFHSDLDLWDALTMAYNNLPKDVFENLKRRFPNSEPVVLTHCDLNLGDIMVRNGQLVGILDWEYAAYLPVWYEYISASFAFTEMDVEWKKVLRERLGVHDDAYDDARALWKDLISLKQYPTLDEKGKEGLERLASA
ncbi:hypothetical protein APSETT445_007242 [Aspergillus pseudonomiae]